MIFQREGVLCVYIVVIISDCKGYILGGNVVYVYMSCGSTVFFGLGQIKGEGGFSFHFWRKQPNLTMF